MKKLLIITIPVLFFIAGCGDNVSMDETESIFLVLLDADDAVGVDGFDSGGDMDLDHDIGLETEGVGRTFS
ncbi:MAG: hypothetical protein VX497_02875, partial [Candidatus Neomarinimicrobiota bacterium]|nr:hypothetical protein [Candidatus Neomarinimicrobiota bacterium]